MSNFYENLKKTIQAVKDYKEKNPQAIAIACQPQYYEALKTKVEVINSSHPFMALMYFPVYVWCKLPEPYRVYYNKRSLLIDIAKYGEAGDNYMGNTDISNFLPRIPDGF